MPTLVGPLLRWIAIFLFLTASAANAATVHLGWNASPDPRVTGYRLDYGTASGAYTTFIDVGNQLSVSLVLADGPVYYVVVRGYDAVGDLSPPSNELVVSTPAPPNAPPVVTLTSPATGTQYAAPATIPLTATASDPDGSIRDVSFFANGTPIGMATTSPYAGTWSGVAPGTYSLTAVATDNAGATTTSAATSITVTAPTAPPAAGRTNVALASNGGVATASSSYGAAYPASAIVNDERRGAGWGAGGVWADATPNVFPDWVDVAFAGTRTIDEVDVFSPQDGWGNPVEPTATQTFLGYGLVDFTVQYWTGTAWQTVPGGVIRGNTLVWRRLTFAPLTTTRIRVLVEQTPAAYSRIVEIEAYTSP